MSGNFMKWRYVDLGLEDPYTCMAVHEAVMKARAENLVPNTLIHEMYNCKCVFIGYNQIPLEDLRLDVCKASNIKIVRRITGGGAGYMDPKQLNYAFVADERTPKIPMDINLCYEIICKSIITGLRYLGLNARYAPFSDITVNDAKISGNCQTRFNGVVLQHGSILVDFDVDTMSNIIKGPEEKLRARGVVSPERKVTWVCKELGREIGIESLKSSIKRGFEDVFNIKLLQANLTDTELEYVQDIRKKYVSDEWGFGRPFVVPGANAYALHKTSNGLIRVLARIKGDLIKDILVDGDFILRPDNSMYALTDNLQSVNIIRDDIEKLVEDFFTKKNVEVVGVKPKDFTMAIIKAINYFKSLKLPCSA